MTRDLKLHVGDKASVMAVEPVVPLQGDIPVDHSNLIGELMKPLGELPSGTVLGGRVLFGTLNGKKMAFIRYTWAYPRKGRQWYPVCLRAVQAFSLGLGLPLLKDSGNGLLVPGDFDDPRVWGRDEVEVVSHFDESEEKAK